MLARGMVDDSLLGGKRGAIVQDCAAARIGSCVDIFPARLPVQERTSPVLSDAHAAVPPGGLRIRNTILTTSATPMRDST